MTGDYPYVWAWRHRTVGNVKVAWFGDGIDRKGMRCRVLAHDRGQPGSMNSALIEFTDGYRVVTSRGGLRRHDRP